ncbi:hypothetical protein CR513_22430, partial [Mucuna pruriens]
MLQWTRPIDSRIRLRAKVVPKSHRPKGNDPRGPSLEECLPSSKGTNELALSCDEELKLKFGQLFDTLDKGDQFYKRYALNVGFSVRWSSKTKDKKKKSLKRWKYFVSSKEGYKPNKTKLVEESESIVNARRRKLSREGSNVKAVFKLVE